MAIGLRWGTVTSVEERVAGLVRLEVDGEPCIAYPRLTGAVEEGDIVLVNTRSVELGLGSGGFDVLYANLTRGLRAPGETGAHVVALPYTPCQVTTRFAEESHGVESVRLGGLPVICTGLHSQLAPVCAALAGRKVVYVQLGGGALPVSLSDTVRTLRARRLLETAVAVAPCLDGDVQCVTLAGALTHAVSRRADAVVCGIGPGIVGTASRYGHGGLAVADAANAASALGGTPIVAARVSFADERERHHGLSHHTRSALELCLGDVRVAWPRGLDPPGQLGVVEVDTTGWEAACSALPLDHMGRGPGDDPWFFAASFAAGRLAVG